METMLLWENAPGLCEEIPTLEYYPAKEKKTDAAVVICPMWPSGHFFFKTGLVTSVGCKKCTIL